MQNDPDRLLARVIGEARALGIPVSRRIRAQVAVNGRAVGRFGQCRKTPFGYEIELSERLLAAPERACRQILAHEVLHTCPGCANHGPRWKDYAARMNAAYGYEIRRTGDCAELGVPDLRAARYAVRCTRCGAVLTRQRRSSLIAHPERYRCRCGGAFAPADLP